jgi:hypothetical protein
MSAVDPSRPPILLHVGYHKTGSSWLQRRVFASPQSGFEWLGRPWQARQQIVAPHPLAFDPAVARAHYQAEIERAQAGGRIVVFSDERFSGNPHSGGYDSKENAQRLAATFPEARILLVIRRQADMLRSAYDQYVDEGGACSIRDYLQPPRTRLAMPSFRFEHFEYHRLIEHYQQLFGPERVLVLAFEQFRADGGRFLRRIMQFAGNASSFVADPDERVNAGRLALLTALQRRLNPFLVRDDLNGHSILALPNGRRILQPLLVAAAKVAPSAWNEQAAGRLRAEIERRCAGRYEASNARTALLSGLPLRSLGYELS